MKQRSSGFQPIFGLRFPPNCSPSMPQPLQSPMQSMPSKMSNGFAKQSLNPTTMSHPPLPSPVMSHSTFIPTNCPENPKTLKSLVKLQDPYQTCLYVHLCFPRTRDQITTPLNFNVTAATFNASAPPQNRLSPGLSPLLGPINTNTNNLSVNHMGNNANLNHIPNPFYLQNPAVNLVEIQAMQQMHMKSISCITGNQVQHPFIPWQISTQYGPSEEMFSMTGHLQRNKHQQPMSSVRTDLRNTQKTQETAVEKREVKGNQQIDKKLNCCFQSAFNVQSDDRKQNPKIQKEKFEQSAQEFVSTSEKESDRTKYEVDSSDDVGKSKISPVQIFSAIESEKDQTHNFKQPSLGLKSHSNPEMHYHFCRALVFIFT